MDWIGKVKGGLFELVWPYERSAYGCMVNQIGSVEVNNDVVDVINND